MFEKIVLRRSDDGLPLTLGDVAEALLYYQHVQLILDANTLGSFLDKITMENLIRLIEQQNISAIYIEESLGTRTEGVGVFEKHSFMAFTIHGDQKSGQLDSRKKRLEFLLERKGYSKKRSEALIDRFRQIVSIRKTTDNYFLPGGILNAAALDMQDPNFVYESIRKLLEETEGTPSLLGQFKFEILHTPNAFHVFSDIDFNKINQIRSQLQPPLEKLTTAHLLNEILLARADMAFAAHYGGDFRTAATTSKIIQLRYDELLRQSGINYENKKQMQEIVLPDCKSIREAIDSGEKSFDDFLLLLEKSDRFKKWIKDIDPDEKLVRAYFKEVSAEGWIQSTQSKTLRYVLGSAIGAIAPLAGLVIGAVDTLFLEKIISGWKPSHFIDDKLRPFLSNSKDIHQKHE